MENNWPNKHLDRETMESREVAIVANQQAWADNRFVICPVCGRRFEKFSGASLTISDRGCFMCEE